MQADCKSWVMGLAAAMVLPVLAAPACAETVTDWVDGSKFKIRLVGGSASQGAGPKRTYAAVEMRMASGWKTYWRMPGDAGGMPPRFDWTGSVNLAAATVLYPAPQRMEDAIGDAVGYKGAAIFPVSVQAKDPAKPVELKAALEFGVCREICIPAEATLSLVIPPETAPAPSSVTAALSAVPRKADARLPNDPQLKSVEAHLQGDKPKLVVEALYPADAKSADMFVEGPQDIYLPVPVKVGESNGVARFEVDLSQNSEAPPLMGKTLTVTMTSKAGASEARWVVK